MPIEPEPASIAEVRRLHRFFEDWFAGIAERNLTEFSEAMGDTFTIVTPGGRTLSREAIVSTVEAAHGRGSVAIDIQAPSVRHDDGTLVVVAYEEHQSSADRQSRRQSTAVMQRNVGSPGGWEWLLVHETWIEPPDQASTPSSR